MGNRMTVYMLDVDVKSFKVTVYQVSWQKCMSFLKCFDLEAKNVINFKICHQKRRIIISNKKISKTKLFRWVLCI